MVYVVDALPRRLMEVESKNKNYVSDINMTLAIEGET